MVAPVLPSVTAILLAVKSAALIPSVHTSVVKITNAVSVQTIIVSMNVPVMLTNACLTGSFVLAAAATIGADPSPASLENRPRATPKRMAAASVAPTKPPVAAWPLNAWLKINEKASGISSNLIAQNK